MAFRSTHTSFGHQGMGRLASSGHTLPRPTPLTVIYNAYVDTNTAGDYSTFWAFGPESFSGADYFTSAVLADANMSTGLNGSDFPAVAVPTGTWMRHAVVMWRDSTDTYEDFYYNLPDLTAVSHGSCGGGSGADPNYFTATSGTTFFRFLDVAWADNETLDGRLFGAKCFQAKLPAAACAIEATSPYPVLPQYRSALWGCWPIATHLMAQDISGNNRHLYASGTVTTIGNGPHIESLFDEAWDNPELLIPGEVAVGGTTRGTPFGHRGTAFNGGRTFLGIIQ